MHKAPSDRRSCYKVLGVKMLGVKGLGVKVLGASACAHLSGAATPAGAQVAEAAMTGDAA